MRVADQYRVHPVADCAMPGSPESQRGMSLIELMVGMVATITILGAMFATVIQRSTQRRGDSELNRAFAAAAENLERLRSIPSHQLPAIDGTGFDVPGDGGQPGGLQPMAGDPDGLPGLITIQTESTGAGATLYRATVVVQWSGVRRSNRFALECLIGERP